MKRVEEAALDFEDFGVGPAGGAFEEEDEVGGLLEGSIRFEGVGEAGGDGASDAVEVGEVGVGRYEILKSRRGWWRSGGSSF